MKSINIHIHIDRFIKPKIHTYTHTLTYTKQTNKQNCSKTYKHKLIQTKFLNKLERKDNILIAGEK